MSNHEWLNLVEISGPFLAVPVLNEIFPQGLEAIAADRRRRLRQTYDEWRDSVDTNDPDLGAIHDAWISEVLESALEMDAGILRRSDDMPAKFTVEVQEHGISLTPDLALVNPGNGDDPLLLIHVFEPDTDLETTRHFNGLATTLADRMVSLLRATGCPIGIVTNGERWMLVHAPSGSVASFASWYARLWGQEPETLRAFTSLLGVRRFFGPEDEQLPALFERSLKHQDDVTDALGEQVRRAVEVLVQALDRADEDRNRELLRDIDPRELYEAGLTVMMRLVFLLAAEERGLLLLGDSRYDAYYAVSTLRVQLRAETEEILERRRSAWSRLLALFRSVYGGIEHPTLHLPALGGSLFDPDRYPFLEGRKPGTSWRTDPAEPLPIDDRTVLLLLEAIQIFQGRTLSYRALDVEQIGHVYEGLLERTVKRVDDVTLELESSSKAKDPRVTLGEIESARLDGSDKVVSLLEERSERSKSAIRNALDRDANDQLSSRLLTVCRGDASLRDRILPYATLLRTDPWGYPLVHQSGAFVVVLGTDRRESGTHYTPKSLTEKIVEETLTPVVYRGPAEGKPPAEWELKSAGELLDLKICDPAMGSGAFLVQACRWLSDRLIEAWATEEANGRRIDSEGRILNGERVDASELLSSDIEERAILARRLIAERCLYGVDMNPLAVELAKLSLWLTTVAKGRPFGFLDHNLRSGDSLLGIHDLGQLIELDMNPKGSAQRRLFGSSIRASVDQAIALRARLREIPIRDIHDVEAMAALDAESRTALQLPERIADALVGVVFSEDKASTRRTRLENLAALADKTAGGDNEALDNLLREARRDLAKDAPNGEPRNPFHWPLEFPEVFERDNGGFSAIVGNPPFLGGQRITGAFGTAYRDWLVSIIAEGRKGSADLVAYFFLRAFSLLRDGGGFGLLAVNTIAEGDTRQVGLESMVQNGSVIHSAYPNEPWPGSAAVATSRVHIHKGEWCGKLSLLGKPVEYISPFLSAQDEWTAERLKINESVTFQGSIVLGMGFVLAPSEAKKMLDADPKNAEVLFPYLNGQDLNSDPEQRPSRWAINFWDWPEQKAQEYKLPWEWIEEHVKPERQRKKPNGDFKLRKPLPQRWWQYGEKRPGLYHTIGRGHQFEEHPKGWDPNLERFERVLAIPETTKYCLFSFVENKIVLSHMLKIVASSSYDMFCVLNSSLHECWARKQSSTLETRLKYITTSAFETFPFPEIAGDQFENMGRPLEQARSELMKANRIGLTKLYNIFHNSENTEPLVANLRDLHREIDLAVARAYGWDDLDLGHGFHEVPYLPENDRVRFTISEPARIEVLRRLAELNRQRYEEEVAQGLHGKKKPAMKRRPRKAAPKQNALDLGDLLNFDPEP